MARMARVVIPGFPHHITQRGNRQQKVFFNDADYQSYIDLVAEGCAKTGVEIWAWCLMPNHVHMIAVPPEKDSLRGAIADAHRRYARRINARESLTGHLWQDRFASFPMDEKYLIAAARYIELNPVRANMVKRPEEYRWSSAKAHLTGQDDLLVRVKPMLGMVGSWKDLLEGGLDQQDMNAIRSHESTGRPLGNMDFLETLERKTGRKLIPGKRGPKAKVASGA